MRVRGEWLLRWAVPNMGGSGQPTNARTARDRVTVRGKFPREKHCLSMQGLSGFLLFVQSLFYFGFIPDILPTQAQVTGFLKVLLRGWEGEV